MNWLFAVLASTAIWIVGLLIASGDLSNISHPNVLMMLFFSVPLFWVPLLIIFSVAAVLARVVGGTWIRELFVFYAFATLLCGAILAIMYLVAPNPHNRDAAFEIILKTMLVPSLLSSIAFSLLVIRKRSA